MEETDRAREDQVRRLANKKGLLLRKSRKRRIHADPDRRYWFIDPATGQQVGPIRSGTDGIITLEEAEAWLTGTESPAA